MPLLQRFLSEVRCIVGSLDKVSQHLCCIESELSKRSNISRIYVIPLCLGYLLKATRAPIARYMVRTVVGSGPLCATGTETAWRGTRGCRTPYRSFS
ncbi:unnamed protein product [Caretta caretta]